MKKTFLLSILFSLIPTAQASVSLPYGFSAGSSIKASEVNADLGALRDEINAHESHANGHNTRLSDVLTVNNSCGLTPINFNGTQALTFRVENVSSDPTAGASTKGRLIFNTTDGLFKIDNGSSYVSIAGTGVNTLTSVLNSGNSAGTFNLNMNGNQILGARVENLTSNPSAGSVGRIFFNTTTHTLGVDTGSAIAPIGGAQGLASVLSVSNSTGSYDVDFGGHQAINMIWEQLTSNPGSTTEGRAYYNTTSHKPMFYNGTSWLDVGNTNTLAQTMTLGNSAGSNDLNMNGHEVKNAKIENLPATPGTGDPGHIWFDTVTNNLSWETSGANRVAATVDSTQTLFNKTISGSSNTISNVPDSALSANIDRLNTAQTITAAKTFAADPTISNIKTPSGATHSITDGLADDTVVLANATQELKAKTLNAPNLSGNLDYNFYQGTRMRVENLSADPAVGHPGRIYYKTTTGEMIYDDGSFLRVLAQGNPTLIQVLSSGNSTGIYDLDLNLNQLINARAENVAALPPFGNIGRSVFNTTTGQPCSDTGTAWICTSGDVTLGTPNGLSLVGQALSLGLASSGVNGALSGTDWDTFNNKQPAGNYITALTGDVVAAGPGSVGAVVASVATSSAANVHAAELLANAATDLNTPSTIVKRDASGNFSAGTITADVIGNVTGSTTGSAASFTGPLAGDVSGTQSATVVDLVGTSTAANVHSAELAANAATNLNTASTIVKRDASGDFSAGTITANLTGNASGTSANVTGTVAIANGGTGQTAKTAAFNALSPNSAAGDITVHDGTNNVTLPIGSNGQALIVDTALPTKVKWGPGGGGSGGGINFVGLDTSYQPNSPADKDAEISVGNWAAFADAASTIPTNMTGGSPTTTIGQTTTGGEVLNGLASFKVVKGAVNAQGEGASVLVNIPPGYRSKTLTLSAPFQILSGSLVQGDLKMFVYDVTNSTIITPFNNDVIGTQGVINAIFPVSLNTAQIRAGFYFSSTAATALTYVFDDFSISPQGPPLGLAGGNWESATDITMPNFGSTSENNLWKKRIGDTLYVEGYIKMGAGSSGQPAIVQLPSSLPIDTAKRGPNSQTTKVGDYAMGASSRGFFGTIQNAGDLYYEPGTTDKIYFSNYTFANTTRIYDQADASGIQPATNAYVTVRFSVPIAGWDANVTMAESSTFKISSYLANGTRVTGTAPAKLGEYRSYLRNASALTYTETSATPTLLPSVNDGIAIYPGGGFSTADTSGSPSRYDIFVGKNKNVKVNPYASAGRTGAVDISTVAATTTDSRGFFNAYDPATGILSIGPAYFSGSEVGHGAGTDTSSNEVSGQIYFDITVSENALAVGVQAPRSEVYVYGDNGYGGSSSGETAIKNFLTPGTTIGTAITYVPQTATTADSFKINEDGVYAIENAGAFAGGEYVGISLNSSQLSTGISTINAANRKAMTSTSGAGVSGVCTKTLNLHAGDVVRAHNAGTAAGGINAQHWFGITKVSN